MEILDDIPFEFESEKLFAELHIDKESQDAKDIEELVQALAPVIKPKAIYEVSYIESRGYERVDIGGVTFRSRVLSVNLEDVERVFPYIATCGREVDEIIISSDDFLKRFWLDAIKQSTLDTAREYLIDHIKQKYALKQVSKMSPGAGSQDLWPIEQQKQLFSIFGNVEDLIGVTLTDRFLMIPIKSVSGLFFPTEMSFESCQLCPREGCPGRRAPYDESLLESFYKDKA